VRNLWKPFAVGAALAATCLTAGIAQASVHKPSPGPPDAQPIFGTVGVINANNFVVERKSSDMTVYYNFLHVQTTFVANSSAAQSAGFVTGDDVVALGHPAGKSIVATKVIYDVVPIALSAQQTVAGQFVAHASGTLTIGTSKAKVVVQVGTYTKYRENGKITTKPTYRRGDHITAKTQEYSDTSWHAKLVIIQTPNKH